MKNRDKEESSPISADTSSSCVSLCDNFILLPGPDVGIDFVLFYARHMEELLDDYIDFTFLLFEGFSQKISRVHGIVNTFGPVFVGLAPIK